MWLLDGCRAGFLAVAVAALAGCGGSAGGDLYDAPEGASVDRVLGAEVERCAAGSVHPLRTRRVAFGAAVRERAAAYDRPGGRVVARFERLNVNRAPTVFGVLAARVDERCDATWYRVQLPVKPNGRLGWVRADDVQVGRVATRIVVDLSSRRVTLLRHGKPVLSTPAAIGSSATPTPTGSYYVNQRLLAGDDSGPFGPGAIGISAFSDVLTGWAQGGPIAIHGTNQPWSVGRAVSNGCLRVPNDVLRRLFRATLAGTPVEIRV
jgi:hypothetical protein